MAESSPTSTELRQICRRILSKPPSMSSSSVSLTEELRCCVCLDVFSDPVSTPCGHNFCRICLKQCWDISQIYSCPYCKETFSKRPELKINTALREVTLIFKEKSSQVKSKKISRRRSEVLCDICEERKAQKSFLMCQTSYCETHLDLHEKMSLKKHKLLDPVENIKDYICEKHERPLELFCRDDQTCVCVFCTDGDHKNHNTVPLEEESKEKKTQLMKTQTDIQQMIQKRIKKIQDIKHSAELRKRSREQEKAASVELFSDLIRSIERCQTELLEMMEEEQKAEEKQDEDLIKNLKQEITELKWRDRELEKITHSEDHLHLIQIDPSSLYRAPDMKNWSEISMKTHVSVETLRRALTQLQETLNEKLTQTDLSSPEREAVEQLIPGYRRSYAKYSAQFTQAPDIHKRPRSAKSEHPTRCSFTDCARGNGDAIAQNESDREAVEEPLPGRCRFSLPHITLATDVRRRSGRAASELPSRCSFTDRVQVTEDAITQHESGKTPLVIVTCITCHMYSLASSISTEGFTCAKCIEVVRLTEKIAELEARIQTLVDDSNTANATNANTANATNANTANATNANTANAANANTANATNANTANATNANTANATNVNTANATNANTANATNTVSGAPSVKRNTHSSVPSSESRGPTNWVTVRRQSRFRCPPKTPLVISNRFDILSNTPTETSVKSALVIGDSILRNANIEAPATIVDCIPGARSSDIRSKLKVLANAKRKFSKIVIHAGTNDTRLRQSEITKDNIKEICEIAKTMSDNVICSGPLPAYRGDETYS
ncbi:uncharacterized protein [Misgurnus anguillicaudatus]|uniref:uncharacterized protein isoform X1 n=1 Tax=Misgurnus anguillicaudatus TaxID=75329 RepID=UPI003CCF5FDE